MSTPDALRLAEACDLACIASCECVTASPDPAWHETHCKYRTLREAATELRRQHAEIELLRDELNLCCALKREYQQQAAGGIERQHAEIERLTGINSALCRKTNALTIQSARDAEEIERLRADAARLRAAGDTAAKAMSLLTPHGICEDAHHAKADRHEAGEPCPVATRYIAAYHGLRGAIDAAMRDATNARLTGGP